MFGNYKKSIKIIHKLKKDNPLMIITPDMIIEALEKAWEDEEEAYAQHMDGRKEGEVNGR